MESKAADGEMLGSNVNLCVYVCVCVCAHTTVSTVKSLLHHIVCILILQQ